MRKYYIRNEEISDDESADIVYLSDETGHGLESDSLDGSLADTFKKLGLYEIQEGIFESDGTFTLGELKVKLGSLGFKSSPKLAEE